MRNRRAIICAALALAVPLPAYALTSGGEDAGPAALSVSASLDSCGIAETQVVCVLDVSFEPIPDARRYRVSVTRADGSVIDYGSIEPGGVSLPVTYVGAGTYGVRVSAHGRPGGSGKPELLDTDVSNARPVVGESDDPQAGKPGARSTEGYAGAGEAGAEGHGSADATVESGESDEVAQDCVEAPATAPPATEPPAEAPPAEAPASEPSAEPTAEDEVADENRHPRSEGSDAHDEVEEAEEAPAAPTPESPTTVAPPATEADCATP